MGELLTGTTIASAGVPPARVRGDRRSGGKRHQAVLLIGRICDTAGSPVCLIHDLSAGGMMARFASPPAVGDTLTVEMRGLPPVRATVRWVAGQKVGFQFATPQDVAAVFRLRREDGTVARPPRFPVSLPAQLGMTGGRRAVTVEDLSAGGARLACGDQAPILGEAVALHLPDFEEPVFGTICWAGAGRAGVRFARPLALAGLARLVGG